MRLSRSGLCITVKFRYHIDQCFDGWEQMLLHFTHTVCHRTGLCFTSFTFMMISNCPLVLSTVEIHHILSFLINVINVTLLSIVISRYYTCIYNDYYCHTFHVISVILEVWWNRRRHPAVTDVAVFRFLRRCHRRTFRKILVYRRRQGVESTIPNRLMYVSCIHGIIRRWSRSCTSSLG